MPGLNLKDVRRLPIPVSPLLEQVEVCQTAAGLLAIQRKTLAQATASAQALSLLDQSILAKAFRGELVPQDPHDEPAEALLARIRADTAATAPKKPRGRPSGPRAPTAP